MTRAFRSILQGVLLVLIVASRLCAAEEFSGKVVSVADGDTIGVMRDGKEVRIRFNGIDCPESHQDFGNRAKQFTSDKAFGKTVKIVVLDKDRYGRLVGDVILPEGENLNQMLVREGLAWWYRQYAPDDTVLKTSENDARIAKRGLWGQGNPIAPWDFRKGDRSPEEERAVAEAAMPESPVLPPATSGQENAARITKAPRGQMPLPSGFRVVLTTGETIHPLAISYEDGKFYAATADEIITIPVELMKSCYACGQADGGAPAAASAPAAPQEESEEVTVYLSKTGTKYHRQNCRTLRGGGRPVSLKEAKRRGFEPCKVCSPPQ